MKKQFLGILIFIASFAIGFLYSPIRFTSFAVGSGLHGGFTSYVSTYLEKVSCEREWYETPDEVENAFEERIKHYSEYVWNQEVEELSEGRAVITYQTVYFEKAYCVIKRKNTTLYNICSTSLWHAAEFEKQKFQEK